MITIKSIETRYAGCRFRSRLEARWAVFFDTLGIKWLYEPQGYTIGPDNTPYLPDFWLPELKIWVEVKGALTAVELRTLIYAASAAGLPPSGPAGDSEPIAPFCARVLLLGDIPAPSTSAPLHSALSVVEDIVFREDVFWLPAPKKGALLFGVGYQAPLNQYLDRIDPDVEFLKRLNHGRDFSLVMPMQKANSAYMAARAARFEHGEAA